MGYVAARCPNCGGDLQLNSNMEKGYCIHCGTPIYFKDAVQKIKIEGTFNIDGIVKLDNLITLIKKDLQHGLNQTSEFRNRLSRALELDPNNQYLYDLQLSEIWNAKIYDGRLIEYQGNIRKVVVPDCISVIDRYAFKSCNRLRIIVLPKSINRIIDGAFCDEKNLVISTYKDTYAARYALASPASLHIIDDEHNQRYITKIERMVKEISAFKDSVINEITQYYSKKIFIRIVYPFFFATGVLLLLVIISALCDSLLLMFISFILAIVIYIRIPRTSKEYNNACRQLAAENQLLKFFRISAHLLNPLGIKDFRYEKDIWRDPDIDLRYDAKNIENAKNIFFNIDKKQFQRKPEIHLPFAVFLFNKTRDSIRKKFRR